MSYLKENERKLASRFLFLSMAISVINQDLETIRTGPFKLKDPYIKLLEQMHTKATKERRQLQRTMKKHNLKIVLIERDSLFSTYLFISEKREEVRNYFNPTIKENVQKIFFDLLLEAKMKSNNPSDA